MDEDMEPSKLAQDFFLWKVVTHEVADWVFASSEFFLTVVISDGWDSLEGFASAQSNE